MAKIKLGERLKGTVFKYGSLDVVLYYTLSVIVIDKRSESLILVLNQDLRYVYVNSYQQLHMCIIFFKK